LGHHGTGSDVLVSDQRYRKLDKGTPQHRILQRALPSVLKNGPGEPKIAALLQSSKHGMALASFDYDRFVRRPSMMHGVLNHKAGWHSQARRHTTYRGIDGKDDY
jgi:hypothetical protein